MNVDFNINVNEATILCEIMGRHNSDKGNKNITNSWHNYTTLYYHFFKNIIQNNLRVFELGLGTNNPNFKSNMGANGTPGASLYGWAEFFPNAQIFGADIDRGILFNKDRIKTFYCDQTNPDIIKEMWAEPLLKDDFDIIIEDGLHEFDANVCFFENSIHKLKKGGVYIAEDITKHDFPKFESKLLEWEDKYTDCLFKLIPLQSSKNTWDNTLLVVYKKE